MKKQTTLVQCVLVLMLLISCNQNSLSPPEDPMEPGVVFQDWSKAQFNYYSDDLGSTISATVTVDPVSNQKGLTINTAISGWGWAGMFIDAKADLSYTKSLYFKAKSIPTGPLQIGLVDSARTVYITTIEIPSNEWTVFTVPLVSFHRTPYPDSLAPKDADINVATITGLTVQIISRDPSVTMIGPISLVQGTIKNQTIIPVALETPLSETDSILAAKAEASARSNPRSPLNVQGNRLVDNNGNIVVLRGLCLGGQKLLEQGGRWSENYFKHAAAWGATIVRLPISPFNFREADPKKTFAAIDEAVKWSKKYGMYLILDWHSIGNVIHDVFIDPEKANRTTIPETIRFWSMASQRYATEPTIAFYEVFNEPAAIDWKGGELNWTEWRDVADIIIDTIYAHNPKAIPVVGGINFAYDFTKVAAEPLRNKNIVFAVHPYPGNAKQVWEENWEKDFGFLAKEYPMIFTEFGFDPNDKIYPKGYKADTTYGERICAFAKERGISWTAFVFFNSSGWPMPLFKDWNYTPTESGAFFKRVLQNQ